MIVPCHPRNRETLRRTLDSLEAAEGGREAEIVVVEDTEGRGPSWARNRGLCKATGEVVFFCDADDLARVIDAALADPARLEAVGERARETIPIPWSRLVDQVLENYARIIDAQGGASN